jgi:hypothetical protein
MPDDEREHKTIPLNSLYLDSETYRALSITSYSDGVSMEKLISDMLKKQLAMQGFLRHGFQLFHKDLVKTLANSIPDEMLIEGARNISMLAKEMVILNVGGTTDVKKYIESFASFMDVNGYPVRINEDEKHGTITFFVKPNLGYKYSLFWSEIIKMTLADFAEITKTEVTDSSLYIECRRI